jgi:hypothetical protein
MASPPTVQKTRCQAMVPNSEIRCELPAEHPYGHSAKEAGVTYLWGDMGRLHAPKKP